MASSASSNSEWARPSGDQTSLFRYYETLRARWFVVVLCAVIGLVGAGAYVKLAPRSYTAQAELVANPVASGDVESSLSELLHQSGDPTQDVLTAASEATTPVVAAATIKALHLHTTTSGLLGKVTAAPLGQSNIVTLQADASSATAAQQLANTFANQVVAVRNVALRAELNQAIPLLKRQVSGLPTADSNPNGSPIQSLAAFEELYATGDPTLTILATASLPTGPSSPKSKLSLAAGLLGGFVVGIGAAFGLAAVDPRLRRESQLRELFPGSPVLARIPQVGRKDKPRPLIPTELSVTALEGYRTLRTTLSSRANKESHAYLLTGSSPSEGKTTSAIGLAVALAQSGGRVVLIEADLRRPRIGPVLGLHVKYGTEQVLIGEVTLEEALVSVRLDGAPLRVLAAHHAGAQLADRLSLAVARNLVSAAKQVADFVVIDSPPLTAVIDALPLAQIADDVLVVARIGHSRLSKLAELEELLTGQWARPTGIVLVGDAPGRAQPYYYAESADLQTRSDRPVNSERRRSASARSRRT